jgi:dTDP-L-rhamnose 4-epimerase
MKVLVTGAAGFIGSHVVDALCARGDEVIGLDSLDPGVHHRAPSYLRSDVDYCFADLRNWEPDSRFDDLEAVVHLAALGGVSRAAREPANLIAANCGGTARLAEAAHKWTRLQVVILASSFSVYGANYRYRCSSCGAETDGTRDLANLDKGVYEVLCPRCSHPGEIQPITEAASPAPLETYGASKYMQELCFRGFSHCRVQILRFSSVYGKRLRLDDGEATIIARLAGWILSGHPPKLLEDGRQIRDWVYVGDLVAGILAVLSGVPAPSIVNVCSGVPTRLAEACDHIARAVGVACAPEIVGGFRPGDMRHCLGDCSSFQKLLGRRPIPVEEGASLAFAAPSNSEDRDHQDGKTAPKSTYASCGDA